MLAGFVDFVRDLRYRIRPRTLIAGAVGVAALVSVATVVAISLHGADGRPGDVVAAPSPTVKMYPDPAPPRRKPADLIKNRHGAIAKSDLRCQSAVAGADEFMRVHAMSSVGIGSPLDRQWAQLRADVDGGCGADARAEFDASTVAAWQAASYM